MDAIRITLLQTDIVWENKAENLRSIYSKLKKLCGSTEIVVLPEMFSTGFSMKSQELAESIEQETITLLKSWSQELQLAIVGSYIATENGRYFNRAFFLTPEGEASYYDKRHLFRMGSEADHFEAGSEKCIVTYRGWNICLLICYDLRFPVWSRNDRNNYDVLIYVANWPTSRRHVWDALLLARALENQCYVCATNRIGTDGYGLTYNGGSVIYSPKGEILTSAMDDAEDFASATLSLKSLQGFREKFPVWKDADAFQLLQPE